MSYRAKVLSHPGIDNETCSIKGCNCLADYKIVFERPESSVKSDMQIYLCGHHTPSDLARKAKSPKD
jgi:hypothetical protein